MGETERWHLGPDVVEVEHGALTRRLVWTRDGAEVRRMKTSDETVVLTAADDGEAVRIKLGMTGPARRMTLHASAAEAHTGLHGTDLEPEAGSRAAARADWIGRHPHLHTARQTALAAAGVGLPILLVWLLTLVPWPSLDLPSIPWPDLPSIPWPDLPRIPWPHIDLPSIPWPDLPDLPDLPPWVETARKLVVPVLIAFFVARGEVRRRRKAEQKRSLDRESPGDSEDRAA